MSNCSPNATVKLTAIKYGNPLLPSLIFDVQFFYSIGEQIGSGQFGVVSKGEWVYSGESMRIAVKALKQQADEGEKVKFLQEAAIMGQFHHPNIIRLHGVVTVGDPVRLQLH